VEQGIGFVGLQYRVGRHYCMLPARPRPAARCEQREEAKRETYVENERQGTVPLSAIRRSFYET
jgi:hypothetical protein